MSFRVSVFTSPTVARPKTGVYRLLRRWRLLLAGSEDGGEALRRWDEHKGLRRARFSHERGGREVDTLSPSVGRALLTLGILVGK